MSASPGSQTIRLHKQLTAIWDTQPGFGRLAAVNHTVVGRRFMATAAFFFVIGGLLAMLIRTHLASSESPFLEEGLYAQVFTMHGTIMMFLFAIPMLEGLAIYLLPKLLGARDLAFPRLTAYGYWCYLFGGLMLLCALAFGVAPNSGWFMYTPLSSRTYSPGINADFWLLGITFVEISALSAAVEILVSILKIRAPGMSLTRMPIFAWYMLVTAGMMLVGFPPLILGSILLEAERAFDLPFFDPSRGGDPLLWQHLFWLFGHPEVYIIFLPAAGAISTFLPVFAGRPLAGYRAIVIALIALAFLSLGLWVHHMYLVGIPHLALSFFSAASALVAIPTAVQIFAWLATLAHGRPRFTLPMLYFFGFLFIFVLGGLTGVMVAMVPFDIQAHDSHFVVAHLHYVLVGGFVFPLLGAAYYWLPHMTGRLPVNQLAKPAFWLIFAGFNLTFLIMHLTGLRGMPRRAYLYPPEPALEVLNLISSVGSFVMAIGFGLVLVDFVLHFRFGQPVRRNPWRAGTLEWAMPTPPPAYAFASLPHVEARADLLDPASIGPELAAGKGYLGFVREGRMETLAVEAISGRVEQVVELPRPSFLPFFTALATGAFFVSMLFKVYVLAALALLVVPAFFLRWTAGRGRRSDTGLEPIGRGQSVPSHFESPGAPSVWAMIFALTADATLFASLVFGGLFLWLSAPGWPPPAMPQPEAVSSLLALAVMTVGVFGAWRSVRAASPMAPLVLTAAIHIGMLGFFGWSALVVPDPTAHAAGATVFVALLYAALHAAIGLLFAGYGIWRVAKGFVSAARLLDLRIGLLVHFYALGGGAATLVFWWVLAGLGAAGEPA